MYFCAFESIVYKPNKPGRKRVECRKETAPECKWNDATFVIVVEKAHFVLIIRICIQIALKPFSNRIKKQNKETHKYVVIFEIFNDSDHCLYSINMCAH